MLDVSLRQLSFRYDRGAFAISDLNAVFPASTHTSLGGTPGAGASTILRLIAGTLRPSSGDVFIGTRAITRFSASKRPLLSVTSELDVPSRWSVQHALVAAVRARTLDRIDRHHEYVHAVERWQLGALIERRIASLSSTEATRVQLARIELLKPGILVADRLFERVNPSASEALADTMYRLLRVTGCTVIAAPSSFGELGLTDRVVVLHDGAIRQTGSASEVWRHPTDEQTAVATGPVNVVPITLHNGAVDSIIGSWNVDPAPFEGSGVALARPESFHIAARGEESDLILGVEEASFVAGRWLVRGLLTGGLELRVHLPPTAAVVKGRLLPLRYDPASFRLLPRELAMPGGVPTDVIPSLRDSR